MGHPLSGESDELFQLYLYVVSIMCPVGPGAIFALYPDDEGSGETVGTGYDMEEGMQ